MYAKIAEQYGRLERQPGTATGAREDQKAQLLGPSRYAEQSQKARSLCRAFGTNGNNGGFSHEQEERLSNLQAAVQPKRWRQKRIPWHQKVGTGDIDGISTCYSATELGSVWSASGWNPVQEADSPLRKIGHQASRTTTRPGGMGAARTRLNPIDLNQLPPIAGLSPAQGSVVGRRSPVLKAASSRVGGGGWTGKQGGMNKENENRGPGSKNQIDDALDEHIGKMFGTGGTAAAKPTSSVIHDSSNVAAVMQHDENNNESAGRGAGGGIMGGRRNSDYSEDDLMHAAGSLAGKVDKGRRKVMPRREQIKAEREQERKARQVDLARAGVVVEEEQEEEIGGARIRKPPHNSSKETKAKMAAKDYGYNARNGRPKSSGASSMNSKERKIKDEHDDRLKQLRASINPSVANGSQPCRHPALQPDDIRFYNPEMQDQHEQEEEYVYDDGVEESADQLYFDMERVAEQTRSQPHKPVELKNEVAESSLAHLAGNGASLHGGKRGSVKEEIKVWEGRVAAERQKRMEAERELIRLRVLLHDQQQSREPSR